MPPPHPSRPAPQRCDLRAAAYARCGTLFMHPTITGTPRIEHNQDLLRLSRNSKAIVADKSGHDIHLDQPELVIESIRTVRDAIRSHSHLK